MAAHRVLQARAREVLVGPRRPLADHRAQEAGRPAGDLGKSDPRFGGRVRDPAASRSHCRLHRSGSQSQRGGRRTLRRHARTDCGPNRGDDRSRVDRRRHQAHDDGVGSLPKAHGDSRRRPTAALAFALQSTIPRASADHETSAPISASFQNDTSPGKSTDVGGISNAETGGCGPCCMRPPTSC